MKKILSLVLSALCAVVFSSTAGAQRFSFSTNIIDWGNLGTMNIEGGVAVSQHISLHTGVRVNPWVWNPGEPDDRLEDPFGENEDQFQNKKQAYNIGLRFWPWYIYSGWWFYAKGQYLEYDRGGLINHTREAGDSFGMSLGAGYTHMLHRNWNLEFGVGVWGGYAKYGVYRCTNCGQPAEQGEKAFILPDDVFISIAYIF